jgi:hypothetical protein
MKPSDTPAWRKKWKIDNQRGIKRVVPAGASQEHVRALVTKHGLTLRGIAEAAGISPYIISDLNRGLKQSVLRTSEKAILAVTAEAVLSRSNAEGLVPNIGGRRRIQALMAMGWRHQDLTPMLGMNSSNVVHQQGEWFTKRKHDTIKALYEKLWDKRGPATTDDPHARPNLGTKVRGRGRPVNGAVQASDAQIENVEFLVDQALRWDAITARLGVEPHSLERMLYRKGRRDLVTRAKNMDERLAYARAS